MGSSPGFGSCACDIFALFGLAFALAPARDCLNQPQTTNSLAHYAKGTPSPRTFCSAVAAKTAFPALSGQKVRGSDSLNAPHFRDYFIPLPGCFSPFPRGTIRYRSSKLFRLGWWSTRIQAGFHVSDPT